MLARPLAPLDALLNRVTMYRLVIYYLAALLLIATAFSVEGAMTYDWTSIVLTTAVALVACLSINALFAAGFDAPRNNDSAVITGLILALIVGPAGSSSEIIFVLWASVLAMASKYVLAARRVHLFNPAAIAVVITALFADQTASWWIGNTHLTPFVIAGGLLLVRRLERGDLVWTSVVDLLRLASMERDRRQHVRPVASSRCARFSALVLGLRYDHRAGDHALDALDADGLRVAGGGTGSSADPFRCALLDA